MNQHLPTHPTTGLRALFVNKHGRAVYPVMGGSPEFAVTVPDDLGELSKDELNALQAKLTEAFKAKYQDVTGENKVPSDTDLEALGTLDKDLDKVNAAVEKVEAEEAQRVEAAAAIAKKNGVNDDDPDGDPADANADTDENDENVDENADADLIAAENQDDEALVASARRKATKSFAGLNGSQRRKKNTDEVPAKAKKLPGFQLAPGVPKRTNDYQDTAGLALAFGNMQSGQLVRSLRAEKSGDGKHVATLATLNREFPKEFVAHDQESLTAAIEYATDESRLPGGSLVAAAAWCSPSTQVYDFLAIPDAGDLYDVPEVGLDKGGIKFPVQPDFGRAFTDKGFLYTEAELIAAENDEEFEKPCFEVPCVGFDEVRLSAIGLCITAGILQQKTWPESVKLYIDGILNAHQHRISSYTIQKIVSMSGAPIVIPSTTTRGAFASLLNTVEMAIEDIRSNQRIPSSQSLEVGLPTWIRPALRADLAHRSNLDPTNPITDALLDANFAARGARVQYTSDWQTGGAGADGVRQPGAEVPIVRWPNSIDLVVYPAGTFFRSMVDVIEVGNLYDQAQLKKNRFTALFTEDGIAVGKRGIISRLYRIPLEYDGSVGERTPLADALIP